jgi:anti-anti-sigma factor
VASVIADGLGRAVPVVPNVINSLQEARLELDDRQSNGHAQVVRPEGRLDMASAPALRHQMRQLMDSGVAKLVLDLSGVSFVDSSGLGAIISGLKLARQAGGDLRIACANQQVLVVLDLTSLNQVLQPYPTVEAALTDF